MGLIGIIIVGLIVGFVVCFLKLGDDSMGWIMIILFGIGGLLLVIYGGQVIGFYQVGQVVGFIGVVVGVVVLLVIYGLIKKN